MIYTITFNPAIDLIYRLSSELASGELNRSNEEAYIMGGKGLNASLLLKRLGHDNIATGFLGGFTGEFIKSELKSYGITPYFVSVDGTTRINAKVKGIKETEINGNGPVVSANEVEQLLTYLRENVTADDVVFLAGNKGNGMSSDDYIEIAKIVEEKNSQLVLDTNTDLLTSCLTYHPFIIKPNKDELNEIFATEVQSVADIIHYAKELQKQGARNVLVSLGGEGSLLYTEDGKIYTANVPVGEVVNSTGAGDSMLSGFIAKYIETKDFAQSLHYGAASGSATAFSTGIATKEKIDNLFKNITIKAIEG